LDVGVDGLGPNEVGSSSSSKGMPVTGVNDSIKGASLRSDVGFGDSVTVTGRGPGSPEIMGSPPGPRPVKASD